VICLKVPSIHPVRAGIAAVKWGCFSGKSMSLIRASVGLGVVDLCAIEVLAKASIYQYEAALAEVRSWLEAGVDLESIYLDGLVPAARLLGGWWLDDRIDFVKVTVGTHCLQQILYEFSPQFLQRADQKFNGYRAIFFSTPGSQHSFGPIMLAEFFRREGWKASNLVPESEADVFKELSQQWFEVIGFSISSDRAIGALKALISEARQVSLNPRVLIMIGGPMVDMIPNLAEVLGADLVGGDARASQRLARQNIKKLELAA